MLGMIRFYYIDIRSSTLPSRRTTIISITAGPMDVTVTFLSPIEVSMITLSDATHLCITSLIILSSNLFLSLISLSMLPQTTAMHTHLNSIVTSALVSDLDGVKVTLNPARMDFGRF